MIINREEERIILEKKPGKLDTFTWEFLKTLEEEHINYTLISGYVAILFGRNRSSEDIDIITEKISEEQFVRWWRKNSEIYECLNTSKPTEAYEEYLTTDHALRFAKKGTSIPNMEIKFPKTEIETWVLKNQQLVTINKEQTIKISPLELQIAYKLFLGSEKDIEDAIFIHELFKEQLNKEILQSFNKELGVQKIYEEHLT